MMTLPKFLARQGADRIVYRGMKGWGRSFSSVRGTALPINEFHAWYINQQHHLYCCASLPRARILIRWFANTARGHFLLWNKTEPTAWLNQYRGLECYRKPRKQAKCICSHSKSMAEIVLLLIYEQEKTWKANEVAEVGCHRIFDGGIFSRGTHLRGFSVHTITHLQEFSFSATTIVHDKMRKVSEREISGNTSA